MIGPERPTSFPEFGAGYWEERYRDGEGAGRHAPSPSLVTEVSDLPPGRALDAGSGNGADAFWLAARGWQVTAVDVSATAVDRARAAARAAGPEVSERIDWVRADLTTWSPGELPFALVTSHFVHVPGPPEELFRRLASWVAPGGTLLVVGHDADADADQHGHGHGPTAGHGHGPTAGHGDGPTAGAGVRPHQVTAGLPEDEWEVLVSESRRHSVRRPDGSGTVTRDDVVVRARRTGPSGHDRSW